MRLTLTIFRQVLHLQERLEPTKEEHFIVALSAVKLVAFPAYMQVVNTLAYFCISVSGDEKNILSISPGPNVIKLFTVVFYEYP